MMKKKVHVISYTHWDREFRFDFETTRMWLVRLMDDLLDIMRDKPDYRYYLLDGQFTLVDDYLEARPERTDEVRALAQEGRLQVGPWYTLPDSSSINGEALVRNLMTGIRRSEAFCGRHVHVGYNVFSFGQIGQLPQLYAGFDIDFIFFYKHMDKTRVRGDEFWWESPDGTRALATHLGPEGRWNFTFATYIPVMYDLDPWHKDWKYHWGSLGSSFHLCEPANYAGFHFITRPTDTWHPEKVREGFDRLLKTLERTHAPEHLLAWDGTDFTAPHPMTPELLEEGRKQLGDEYEIVHSTMEAYVDAVRPILTKQDLDTAVGEMKDGPVGSIHTDVCSTHPELKRANSAAENGLFRQAEPLATWAWTQGRPYPKGLIEKSLKYLFAAQVHDSLHGVGPASMNKDIANRLLQARVIAENVAVGGMQDIATRIDTAPNGDFFVLVFNTASFERDDVLDVYLDLPGDKWMDEVWVEDVDGQRLATFPLEVADQRAGLYHPRSRNMPFYSKRYHLLFEARNIPALGYKVFAVRWKEKGLYPYPHEDFDAGRLPAHPLAADARSAENEHLKVVIQPDGTVDLTDKASGRIYAGLNYYLDSGEAGTLYTHKPPSRNKLISTQGMPAQIALIEKNPLRAVFEVKTVMAVPARCIKLEDRRSDDTVPVDIATRYTLRKGARALEVETTIENRARDHFLRAVFPTGVRAEKTQAGASFDVNTRPVDVSEDGMWQGQELTRHQQHLFMDISDGVHGLAVLNDTLCDYQVIDAEQGVVAQSLVRGMPLRIPVDNRLWMEYPGDDSSQTLGSHTVRYALMPHQGAWDEAAVIRQALSLATPLRAAQIGPQHGDLPMETSWLRLEGSPNLVLSAVKKTEDRDTVLVRFYNPSARPETAVLRCGWTVHSAHLLALNEDRKASLAVQDNAVTVEAGPHKIITVEIDR